MPLITFPKVSKAICLRNSSSISLASIELLVIRPLPSEEERVSITPSGWLAVQEISPPPSVAGFLYWCITCLQQLYP